jgi:hypothetical protein
MAKSYYSFLPKLEYNGVLISDISHRFTVLDNVASFSDFYYKTRIEHHNTPESVSYALYGTTDYWWIICAINNVIDPFYDWVMLETEVFEYAKKVYDDINGIHHYEDSELNKHSENNAEETFEPITNLEWELYLNDQKLQIHTVKPKYIQQINKEMKDRMKLVKPQKQG